MCVHVRERERVWVCACTRVRVYAGVCSWYTQNVIVCSLYACVTNTRCILVFMVCVRVCLCMCISAAHDMHWSSCYVCVSVTSNLYVMCVYKLHTICIGMYINVCYVCVSVTSNLYVMCVYKLHTICIGMYINVCYVRVLVTSDLYVMCVYKLHTIYIGMYINICYMCVSVTSYRYVMCVYQLHTICIGIHINACVRERDTVRVRISMGWLRLVGSLNYRSLLQKSPIKKTIFYKRHLEF